MVAAWLAVYAVASLGERWAAERFESVPWPTGCPEKIADTGVCAVRCARLRSAADLEWASFHRDHVQPAIPLVITNGSALFGDDLSQWGELDFLEREFGHTEHTAGWFDETLEGDRLGIQPKGDVLRRPHRKSDPMALSKYLDIARSDSGQSFFLEQSAIYDVVEVCRVLPHSGPTCTLHIRLILAA
jgi:hypothetical protein